MTDTPSPMVQAYRQLSAAEPDSLILYRVGEFYEVLAGHAEPVSRALGIQMTRRPQKGAADIPMCGVPAGSIDKATARLLSAGHRLVLSEQPPAPGGDRPLIRLTPATSVNPDVLAPDRSNVLLAVHATADAIGLAALDLSTGEAQVSLTSLTGCAAAITRLSPAEILVSQWPDGSEVLARAVRAAGVPFSDLSLTSPRDEADDVQALLPAAFGDDWQDRLRGFSPLEVQALGLLLGYVRRTTGVLPDHLTVPKRAGTGEVMEVDAATLRGLEVLDSPSGPQAALFAVMDRTVSPAGARLLRRQLAAPLTSIPQIERRLAMVAFFVAQPEEREACREELSASPDMLRASGRLSLGKGSPRDLAAIRDGLVRAATIASRLQAAPQLPAGLGASARELASAGTGELRSLTRKLQRALAGLLPADTDADGYVAARFSVALDTARQQMTEAEAGITTLQQRWQQETGIRSLKIRSNSLIGYHVEVPASAASGLLTPFSLRQGLASTSRFSAPDLDRVAVQLAEAAQRVRQEEQAVFRQLSQLAVAQRDAIARVSHAMAALDLVAGLAQAAAEGSWSQPRMMEGQELHFEGGRHPVVEPLLEAQGRSFVPNDCHMREADRVWLLTGPNMAGKSTFLRQVALIVLMAQVGSFVPARAATVGIVDKLFSRIGAGDDLAAGRSTFMVEMLETAAILTQATARSLVILDEVGRGTSTHDGLSLAQASMEYLHDTTRCRTLFATHFQELADVAERLPLAVCMAMDTSPGRHDDIFSYKVVQGRASGSYGLRVARLAGVPAVVVERAEHLLWGYAGGSTPV